MSIASRFGALVFLALVPFVFPAAAQQTESLPQQPTDKIVLNIVVASKSGHPVADLTQQDFKVLDNKVPQTVTSFQALGGDNAPVEVLIVIDAVNANFSTVALEREQIEKFLRSHGEHLAHPTSMALLSDTGLQIEKSPSTDGNALSAALDQYTVQLRTLRRSSGFYGANDRLNLSINALHQLAALEAPKPGRKLILWVSPGWPLLSGPNVELGDRQQQQIFSSIVRLSTELRQAGVTLYALDSLGANESVMHNSYYENFVKGLTKPRDASLGNLGLQVFSVQSGGRVLNSNDVADLLERCLEDATAYYEISYQPRPAEHRDEYHGIEIQMAQPGLTARALKGYYSQP